jgi:hypothetical protein
MRLTFTLAIALVLATSLARTSSASAADTFDPSTDAVFQKIMRVNPGLKSYTAHVEVTTRLFFGRFTLRGTLYNWGPESKVVFEHVPSIAKSAVESQPTIEAPSEWTARYTISRVSQTADATAYRLIPRDSHGIRSIDIVADNASGLVREYTWSNENGLTITSDQTYAPIDGYQLIESSTTRTRGRGMTTESIANFSDYDLNDPIPPSVVSSN